MDAIDPNEMADLVNAACTAQVIPGTNSSGKRAVIKEWEAAS